MSTLTRVTSNTLYQLLSKLINAFSGFIIIAIITRSLGEPAVGAYTLILTYISLYFIAVDYGANAYAVKAMQKEYQHVFNKLLAQRLAIGIVVTLIACIIVLALPSRGYTYEIKINVLLVSSVILVQAILATSNAVFQFREKYVHQMIINLVSAGLNVVFVLIATQTSFSLQTVMLAYLIASIAGAGTSLLQVKKYTQSITPLIDAKFNQELARETLPITISMITNLLYFRIDALVLPFFRTLQEVGHYNIAYRIFENALVIPSYLGNALYPTLLRIHDQVNYQHQLKKVYLTSLCTSIVLSIAIMLFSPFLIYFINGTFQQQTIDYIRILSLGLPIFFMTSLIMWQIITAGKQRALVWIYGSNMLISIVLNVTLIPRYGAYASAWLTILLEAFVLICSYLALRTQRK